MTAALCLALILLLACVSVFLTSIEAGFNLLKRRRLGHVAVTNPRAELSNRYLDDPPSLLMPVQIGTYGAHVCMTVLLTSLLLDWLGHGAILAALGVMTAYLFVFRLTLPYAIVRRNPERVMLVLLPAFHGYAQALGPIVSYLRRRVAPGPTSAAGGETGAATTPSTAPAESTSAEERAEQRLVTAVERFTSLVVRNIMTPRADMVAVPASLTLAEMRKVFGETKYSRVPVFGENLDDIVGMIGVRDLVECEAGPGDSIQPLVRPAHLVPETKRVADLLKEMQAERATMAVVIDEYGGTAGLVSVEDIVEELVGEIKDEYDSEAEPILREADGALVVHGRVNLDRVEAEVGARLHEEEDIATVGGLVAKVFGRIPRPGERADHGSFSLEVLEADRKRVNRVRFRQRPPQQESAP